MSHASLLELFAVTSVHRESALDEVVVAIQIFRFEAVAI